MIHLCCPCFPSFLFALPPFTEPVSVLCLVSVCRRQRLDFSGIEPDVKPFEERFGRRIMVSCHDLAFSLQGCVSEKGDGVLTNVR